jgi:hypothetical protein
MKSIISSAEKSRERLANFVAGVSDRAAARPAASPAAENRSVDEPPENAWMEGADVKVIACIAVKDELTRKGRRQRVAADRFRTVLLRIYCPFSSHSLRAMPATGHTPSCSLI